MTNDIDALVRRMSRIAEDTFNENGEIPPLWLFDEDEGQSLVATPFNGDSAKVEVGAHMGRLFQDKGVWRYACAMECWTSASEGVRPSLQPDRKEAVIIYAQDRESERLAMREIIRADGGAYLTKLAVEIEPSGTVMKSWFTKLLGCKPMVLQ